MDVIIFDVDGVLGDFTKLKHLRDIAHIQNVALKHNIDFEAAKELFFSTKKKLKEQDKHSTIDTMMELGFSREEYYESINSVPVEGNIVLTEHAVEVLEKLSKKYNIVALTNTPHDSNKKVLVYLGLDKFVHALYCIDTHDYIKPSSEIFKRIMDDFNAGKGISVGDSVEKDLLPAKEIGLKTVYFGKYKDKIENREGIDFEIDDLRELFNILGSQG